MCVQYLFNISANMWEQVNFVDILEPRRTQSGIFSFMSRNWYPQRTQFLDKYCTPDDLKIIVEKSAYLDAIIEAVSNLLL